MLDSIGRKRHLVLAFAPGLVLASCAESARSSAFDHDSFGPGTNDEGGGENDGADDDDGGGGGSGDDGGDDGGDDAPIFDVGNEGTGGPGDDSGDCPEVPGSAIVTGTVYAPNGWTPISGAVVYASPTPPEVVPDEVYCQECVELDCNQPSTFTNPDGTFSLQAYTGSKWVVVQKGQFVRATRVDLVAGANPLPAEQTTFPSQRDEAHHLYIPNIALAWGDYDRMENLLAKLGMADHVGGQFQAGGHSFDIYERETSASFEPIPQAAVDGTFDELFDDPDRMARYHIIFLACSGSETLSEAQIEKIREWVVKGGKLYATDIDAERIDQLFPQYQDFRIIGDAHYNGYDWYHWPGTVLDPDLLAWLEAIRDVLDYPNLDDLPVIDLQENASIVDNTKEVLVDDGQGGQVDVGHKWWVEAWGLGPGNVPQQSSATAAAVTAEYGCGKLMYTGYHNTDYVQEELLAQELTMLYLILEIGVCQIPYDPPPPEG